MVQYTTAFIPLATYPAKLFPLPLLDYAFWLAPALVSALVCTIGALLPDVDHHTATMSRKLHIAKGQGPLGVTGYLGGIFRAIMGGHRGFTHTLVFVALPCVLLPYIPPNYHYLLWAGVTGLCSHLLADMLTEQGVPLLWPLSSKRIGLWK